MRFTTNWIDDAGFARYLSKMAKGGEVWNRLEIVDTNEDYTVVVNHPRDEKRLNTRTTIHLHMEPECTRRTWIDPGCFIRLDLHDPVGALAVVKESIERGEWEKRIEVIRREKSKILDELQIFPTIERLLNQRGGCSVRPGKAGEEGGGDR